MECAEYGTERALKFSVVTMDGAAVLLYVLAIAGFLGLHVSAQNATRPMDCSVSPLPSCVSYLYIALSPSPPLDQIAKNFNVTLTEISYPPSTHSGSKYMIPATCVCNSTVGFLGKVSYTPTDNDTSFDEISQDYYNDLAYISPNNTPVEVVPGEPVKVDLLCGCPAAKEWASVVTYIVQGTDTLDSITATFSSDDDATLSLNELTEASQITPGLNLFIPLNFTPISVLNSQPSSSGGSSRVGLIVGIISAIVVLLFTLVAICLCCRKNTNGRWSSAEVSVGISHSKHLPIGPAAASRRGGGNLAASRRGRGNSVFTFFADLLKYGKKGKGSVNNNVKRTITLPRVARHVFDQEKPVVFKYEEIIAATKDFDESRKLGQGSFGVVYFGSLRNQDVAIKQMKATKSREFFSELKVLCTVHHTNLIELIGYSAGGENLYIVYEFAENGALNAHLHKVNDKGHVPLSWAARVQIALDASKGLEYLHDHTKSHYVHRDVKTSNILLDDDFRGKVSDFGLAMLVQQTDEYPETVSRAGSFGYMAPEYLMGGLATSKCDVYAFGVVLFELITGLEAVTRTGLHTLSNERPSSRRFLVSLMLTVLKMENLPEQNLKYYVDRNLGDCYPFIHALQMANLAKACVDDEPAKRPNMVQIVYTLSQILLRSVEWEAALAGSSQIFSGLVQGR